MEKSLLLLVLLGFLGLALAHIDGFGEQPLSKIDIHKTTLALSNSASIKAYPSVLGVKGEDIQWVNVSLVSPNPSGDDWVGVFSPAKFNSSTCPPVNDPKEQTPYICTAPIKPKLVAVSNFITFSNPKAPLYPRLAQGKSWNEMTVTWTSGYDIIEAVPFVEWGPKGEAQIRSPAATLTFDRTSMCGLFLFWSLFQEFFHN
uniref:Purple acid phosphatase Fn3-like domain-containing protein n=1 Tax=Fagus sylvatica TaxID=28930 RepID=A0A2N9IBH1_FAGSY